MHHFSLDKATYRLLKRKRNNIDKSMLIIGILGPLASLPQIIMIFSSQSAESVSTHSWGFYLFAAGVSLIYAFVHKLRPVFISSIFSVVTCSTVFVGSLIY